MHWKHCENNVKDCHNIDLKRWSFPKLFDSMTQKGNKKSWKLTVLYGNSFKFWLSSYLQLKFDNHEYNCQTHLSIVKYCMQRKTLYQVSFAHHFQKSPLIHQIQSFLNNSSPLNKKIFFQWRQETKRVWSLHRGGFATQFKSNSDLSEKYSENT